MIGPCVALPITVCLSHLLNPVGNLDNLGNSTLIPVLLFCFVSPTLTVQSRRSTFLIITVSGYVDQVMNNIMACFHKSTAPRLTNPIGSVEFIIILFVFFFFCLCGGFPCLPENFTRWIMDQDSAGTRHTEYCSSNT